jgi:hypothetical protein
MHTTTHPVTVTPRQGRLTAGVFTAGPFKGQRAIRLDDAAFLPAGQAEGHAEAKGAFGRVFAELFDDILGSKRQGGAA